MDLQLIFKNQRPIGKTDMSFKPNAKNGKVGMVIMKLKINTGSKGKTVVVSVFHVFGKT